jgi:anaerobic magnesium-protoporphyrin IX monomethyl ester cyclase
LDALPFPDRTIPDYQGYYAQWGYWQTVIGVPVTSILSSRGCPGRCTFCTRTPAELSRWRPRSPENVLQELRQLSRDGYQMAVFTDENLTVSTSRMDHLCRLIIQENLGMRFAFEGFVEHLPDSTLGLMRQAGFDLFFLGVEKPAPIPSGGAIANPVRLLPWPKEYGGPKSIISWSTPGS